MRLSGAAQGALSLALAAAGAALVASEFLTLYEVRSGAVTLSTTTGGEGHSYALLALGALVVAGALLTGATGAWQAAAAAALAAAVALGIALVADLPDATRSGSVGVRLRDAQAAAGAGLYVEVAAAALALAGGVALALSLRGQAER